jgi:adenosylcobinamide-GDP ribazoletransferase
MTRVPIRLRGEPRLERVAPWFPIAGVVIGAAVGGAAAGLWHVVPALVASAVAVVGGVLLTGAFHEDGLADTADAFGGGWTVERRLEILHDPRHGSYGVAALSGSILVRVVALGSLPGPATMFAAAVAAHALGRSAAVGLMATVRPAVASGLGAGYARQLRPLAAWTGVLAGIACAAIATGWWAAVLVVTAAAGAGAIGWLAIRKIGGIGGDVLGACEQVVECLCLVVLTGLARHHGVWWGR